MERILQTRSHDKGSDSDGEVHLVAQDDESGENSEITVPGVQYQLRAETSQGGQVTYRVVPIGPNDDGHSQVVGGSRPYIVSSQAVMQNQFVDNSSNGADLSGNDTKFTYVNLSGVGAGDSGANMAEAAVHAQATQLGQLPGGQFYVMMSPQDVLQTGQRAIAPRTTLSPITLAPNRTIRDERRRTSHNEVERKRRDKINTWIVQLTKLIPEPLLDNSKSKGGILARACDYIQELTSSHIQLTNSLKELESVRQQCEELRQENVILRATLQQNGIDVPEYTSAT